MRRRIPDWISIRKKELIRQSITAAAAVALCIAFLYRTERAWQISDSLFLGGLLFLILGCVNLVRWLGFFDSTVYGYKKLMHHMEATRKNAPPMEPMPSYAEYLEQPKVLPSAGEPLLLAVVLIALSALTAWVM
ncbi:MAG: DUF3899 domain-containing protein [Clostridia bacterium]|nr:DUF3899 domain-containing protein [Clostridia bacterium]